MIAPAAMLSGIGTGVLEPRYWVGMFIDEHRAPRPATGDLRWAQLECETPKLP